MPRRGAFKRLYPRSCRLIFAQNAPRLDEVHSRGSIIATVDIVAQNASRLHEARSGDSILLTVHPFFLSQNGPLLDAARSESSILVIVITFWVSECTPFRRGLSGGSIPISVAIFSLRTHLVSTRRIQEASSLQMLTAIAQNASRLDETRAEGFILVTVGSMSSIVFYR